MDKIFLFDTGIVHAQKHGGWFCTHGRTGMVMS